MPPILSEFLQSGWVWWLVAASAAMFIAGLISLPIIAVRIPEDYFLHDTPPLPTSKRHPIIAVLIIIGRNVLGVLLIILGILLSLPGVPGQGILTVLVGLMLMTIPGKKRAILWIVSFPAVINGLNKLRIRNGKPPLKLPGDGDGDSDEG